MYLVPEQTVLDNIRSSSTKNPNRIKGDFETKSAENYPAPVEQASTSRPSIYCCVCHENVPNEKFQGHLRSILHKSRASTEVVQEGVRKIAGAFKNNIATYQLDGRGTDINAFFRKLDSKFSHLILHHVNNHDNLKVNVELFGLYYHPVKDEFDIKSFNTKNVIVVSSTNINELYANFVSEVEAKAKDFEERDSGKFEKQFYLKKTIYLAPYLTGWLLVTLLYLEVSVNKYNPLRASTYVELPKSIYARKAVINVKNEDDQCFKWAILSALHPVESHPERPAHYIKYQDELDFTGMSFPITLDAIPKFEQLNNISVNVYGLDKKFHNGITTYQVIGPLYYTSCKLQVHVNLLLINDDTRRVSHYLWIKNLSRLVSQQINNNQHSKFLCDGCLLYFSKIEKLHMHMQFDCTHVRTKLPTTAIRVDKFGDNCPENVLKFEETEKKMIHPFVVYADFECLLKTYDTCLPYTNDYSRNDSEQTTVEKSFSVRTHRHEPYSFGYYIKCSYDESLSKYVTYRGPNCAEIFVKRLEDDVRNIYQNHLKHVVPMKPLTKEQELLFSNATHCYICERQFKDNELKVKDHNHCTGDFNGAAHSICNLNYKLPKFIPVFFHNLSGYDSHLFIKQLANEGCSLGVIAQNKEKYVSFSKRLLVDARQTSENRTEHVYITIRFVDSFRFMPMSLEKLGSFLSDNQCNEISRHFPDSSKFKLVRQKGVFPYGYVDCVEKLEQSVLPPLNAFEDNFNKSSITSDEYDRAQKVWKEFSCKTLGEYSDVYLKSDVLLLTDVFENFRKICHEVYQLDPCMFLTAPALSWSAMLKYTGIHLELLTDIDMVHFIKKGIRGGISQCSKRKAIANNKYMSDYDPKLPSSYIAYLDATNLYGAALSQYLPYAGFRWLDENEIRDLDIISIADDSPYGYILEVDIKYPEELHDKHNSYPFCPEQIIPPGSKVRKLILSLYNKERYVIHYRNLKQCLREGLKITKVHRVLTFKQSQYMKNYIDLNTQLRNRAKNEFEKSFYKLMNNAVFGKTMENVEKRIDFKLVTHWRNIGRALGAEALIARPNFKACTVFTENFVGVLMNRTEIVYDKPIYVGFCVLDISKTIMYDFYYGFLKKQYGDNVELLYTDTDSFILELYTDDFYKDIKNNITKFDTSNYAIDNKFNIPKTPSVLGKMKDEYAGQIIYEFYGTGAKCYCVITEKDVTKKAKGVKHNVIREKIQPEHYKCCIENSTRVLRSMHVFRSYLHDVYTEIKYKVALSPDDDKRYILPGSIETLAWGHKDINLHIQNDIELHRLLDFLERERNREC